MSTTDLTNSSRQHFTNIQDARERVAEGEVFCFTGKAYFDAVCLIDGQPHRWAGYWLKMEVTQ